MRQRIRAPLLLALCVVVALSAACRDESAADAATLDALPQDDTPGWFEDITVPAGLDFRHTTGARGKLWMPEIMGAGAAVFDADGDGALDLYLTNGNLSLDSGVPGADAPRNRLYLQQADGRWRDATATSGLGDTGYGMGVAVGDIDNDGDDDVYVTNYGPDRLYRNRGDGHFEEVSAAAGVHVDGWSCSAAFLDFDRDGFLDLYVTRYVRWDPRKECLDAAGRPDYCSPKVFPPQPDVLLRNRGDGTFEDVSHAAGIDTLAAAGLGVVVEDLDQDGWPDIYVANDGYANHLWLNRHDGTFQESAVLLGAAYDLHGRPEAGMGVLAADLDNDLHADLFVTNLANETNRLYRNRGPGRGFEDLSGVSGLGASSLPYTGFGAAALDVELDGDLDLFVANGRVTRGPRRPASGLPAPWDAFAEPNLAYRNLGHGRFEPAQHAAREFTTPVETSRGLATGDLDGDGDLDLLLANVEAGARLYRNRAPRQGHWLLVRAVDPRLRRDALGAVVTLRAGALHQRRTISRGHSYLSSSDPRAHFGLGRAARVDELTVRWPDGTHERFAVPELDRVIELQRGSGKPAP